MKTLQKLVTVIFLFFALSFNSCDYFCKDNDLKLAFVGFDSTDINTIILRQYTSNTDFKNPIDTFLISSNNGRYMFTTRTDTTIIFRNSSDDSVRILGGYDWEVFIPAEKKTVYISDIKSSSEKSSHGCTNPIISFIQDGKTISPDWISTGEFWTEGYRINIKK